MAAAGARRWWWGLVVVALLGAGLVTALRSPGEQVRATDRPAAGAQPLGPLGDNPVAARGDGVKGVAFYYQGTLPLVGSDPDELAAHLGDPAVVVTTPGRYGAEAVDAIHAMGAEAYRYFQFYWLPEGGEHDGLDLAAHPEWAFCLKGDTPTAGRATAAGRWLFVDANETAARERIRERLAEFVDEGWDGVFFDRGQAATQYAVDEEGRPVWHRSSTCTEDPDQPGAAFADAFVNTVGLAHEVGLQAMMNNGFAPFDPVIPMRPDVRDPDCRRRVWARCSRHDDVWDRVDLVLSEAAAAPRDLAWKRMFTGNLRSERDADHGRRTVALVTTATLGGPQQQRRARVFYAWSRIRLFDLATTVNTGDDGCAGAEAGAVCNRHGVYPELTSLRLGEPVRSRPHARRCRGGSQVHCVWVRGYEQGATLVNVGDRPVRDLVVRLAVGGCRHVLDVLRGEPLAGNRCVSRVRLDLGEWQGRPLRYAREAWPAAR